MRKYSDFGLLLGSNSMSFDIYVLLKYCTISNHGINAQYPILLLTTVIIINLTLIKCWN
jgi:hypothetical protein